MINENIYDSVSLYRFSEYLQCGVLRRFYAAVRRYYAAVRRYYAAAGVLRAL